MDQNQGSETNSFNLPEPLTDNSELNNVDLQLKSTNPNKDPRDSLSEAPSVDAINQKVKSIISDDGVQAVSPDPSSSTTILAPVSTTTPLVADDGDLIEKEWVDKAKQIINKNKEDPYLQSVEISHVRADYMKKRYNKDIKLGE